MVLFLLSINTHGYHCDTNESDSYKDDISTSEFLSCHEVAHYASNNRCCILSKSDENESKVFYYSELDKNQHGSLDAS